MPYTPSQPTYGVAVAHDVMVPMRDGIRLATDIYRPADERGNFADGRFPAIVARTSYDKSNPVIWVEPVASFFVSRGYAVAIQDLRGRGQSEGTGQYFHTANQKEGLDGYDTIEWVASQPWCDGRIGMVGSSHGGIVQNMASLYRPPHLAALWVDVAPTNAFMWEARQGGAMGLHMYGAMYLHAWDAQEIRDNEEARRRIEDGAERLREMVWKTPLRPGETPIAAVQNLEWVLMHYYQDGTYTDFWAQESLDHEQHFDRMADIPAVYSSGWYDPFPAQVSEQYVAMEEKNSTPQRLILGPWNHVSMRGRGRSWVGEVDFGPGAHWGDTVYNDHRLRWFDRWLKGVDTGVEDDPPVRYFVMGGGDGRKDERGHMRHGGEWKTAHAWPPKGVTPTPYYLRSGGSLSPEQGRENETPVSWTHDPDHPVPTVGGAVTGFYEWIKVPEGLDTAYVPPRARMRSIVEDGPLHQKERPDIVGASEPYPLLADRPDVCVFQTEPLESDLEIAGPVLVRLWVSSTAQDTDFTAKLIDVCPPNDDYPDGFHLPLCDSILRARYREGFDREAFMSPDGVYELVVELPPVANLFKAGHRIRVDIASSNFPRFDINPNTGEPMGRHTHSVKADNTVYVDADHPSLVELPLLRNRPR